MNAEIWLYQLKSIFLVIWFFDDDYIKKTTSNFIFRNILHSIFRHIKHEIKMLSLKMHTNPFRALANHQFRMCSKY